MELVEGTAGLRKLSFGTPEYFVTGWSKYESHTKMSIHYENYHVIVLFYN